MSSSANPDEVWLVEFPVRRGEFMAISFLTVDYMIPPDGATTGYRLSGYLSACGSGRESQRTPPIPHE